MKKIFIITISTLMFVFSLFAAENQPQEVQRTEEVEREQTIERRPTINVSEDTLKSWKEILEFGVSAQRIHVIHQIYNNNDPKTYPLLLKIIENDVSSNVQREAVMTVRRLEYKEAAPVIMKLLNTDNNDLKQLVIYTLGILKYKPAEQKIIEFFSSDVDAVKIAAINASGELKLNSALPKIHKFAESMETSEQIKEAAIISIGKIGDKSSIEVLKKIFDNSAYSKYMRMFSVTSLGMIGGPEVFEYLVKAFNSNDYFIKLRSVEAFSRINNPESVKYLSAALRDDNEKIRSQALRAIEIQPNRKQFIRQLKYMVDNETISRVRREAVITFIKAGQGDALKYVKEQIEKPGNFFLKYYITLGLERADESEAIPLLKKLYIDNKSTDLRNEIVKIFARKNTDKSINALKDLLDIEELDNVDNLRKNKLIILEALTRAKPELVLDTFKKMIYKGKDIWLRASAVRLVSALVNKKGHQVIIDIVNDDSVEDRVRVEAIRVSGNLKLEDTKKKLKILFLKSGQNQYTQHVIRTALVQMGEDRANLDAELKRVEREQREAERQNRIQSQTPQQNQQQPQNQTPPQPNPSGVERTHTPRPGQ